MTASYRYGFRQHRHTAAVRPPRLLYYRSLKAMLVVGMVKKSERNFPCGLHSHHCWTIPRQSRPFTPRSASFMQCCNLFHQFLCFLPQDWHVVRDCPGNDIYTCPAVFADDWLNWWWDHKCAADPTLTKDDYRFMYIGTKVCAVVVVCHQFVL